MGNASGVSQHYRAGAFIEYFGRQLGENTGPEKKLDALAEWMGIALDSVDPIWVFNARAGDMRPLKPDRQVRGTMVLIHVDAFAGHWTTRGLAKGDWEDGELNGFGFRNLRLPGELLAPRYALSAAWLIRCFLTSDRPNWRQFP